MNLLMTSSIYSRVTDDLEELTSSWSRIARIGANKIENMERNGTP